MQINQSNSGKYLPAFYSYIFLLPIERLSALEKAEEEGEDNKKAKQIRNRRKNGLELIVCGGGTVIKDSNLLDSI